MASEKWSAQEQVYSTDENIRLCILTDINTEPKNNLIGVSDLGLAPSENPTLTDPAFTGVISLGANASILPDVGDTLKDLNIGSNGTIRINGVSGTTVTGPTSLIGSMKLIGSVNSTEIMVNNTNTSIGFGALGACSAGIASSVAIGYNSLFKSGGYGGDTAIGNETLTNKTTGSNNTAIGDSSQKLNITGVDNVSIGRGSLYSLSGVTNSSNSNTVIGSVSLRNLKTGSHNIGIGADAGKLLVTGSENIIIGKDSAINLTGGFSNIYIGTNTLASEAEVSNEIVIGNNIQGHGTDTFTIGGSLYTSTINGLVLINGNSQPLPEHAIVTGFTSGSTLVTGSGFNLYASDPTNAEFKINNLIGDDYYLNVLSIESDTSLTLSSPAPRSFTNLGDENAYIHFLGNGSILYANSIGYKSKSNELELRGNLIPSDTNSNWSGNNDSYYNLGGEYTRWNTLYVDKVNIAGINSLTIPVGTTASSIGSPLVDGFDTNFTKWNTGDTFMGYDSGDILSLTGIIINIGSDTNLTIDADGDLDIDFTRWDIIRSVDNNANKIESFGYLEKDSVNNKVVFNGNILPAFTDIYDMGSAAKLWKQIYALSTSISASDARLKTNISGFTSNELSAAKQLSKEVGTYKFLDAVNSKGDDARIHIGLTVQRAIEIMIENNLSPFAYGFICHDEWDNEFTDIPEIIGVEYKAPYVEYIKNEQGVVISEIRHPEVKGVKAAPAYQKKTQNSGDLYSFRYTELLTFISRGFEERLSLLESK